MCARDVVARWNKEVAKVLQTEAMKSRTRGEGLELAGGPPEEVGAVVKAAIEPVWWLPGVAQRFGCSENDLRRVLFEETGGMYPELVTRSDLEVFLPPIGVGLTIAAGIFVFLFAFQEYLEQTVFIASVTILPAPMQVVAAFSPATYILDGVRQAAELGGDAAVAAEYCALPPCTLL